MSTPGRTPKPTALKVLEGNPGKRALQPDEFRPATQIPECPAHLIGEAKTEWDRITSELARYGMISEVDRGAMAMVCTLWARYVEAEEMIERAARAANGTGLFVKSPNGYPIQSPWVAVSNKSIELYRAYIGEFGLSPSARVRVVPGEYQLALPGLESETNDQSRAEAE
jgi:P27 family predicted phage terminase small subunit